LVLKNELEAKYYYHATVILSVDLMGSNLGNVYLSGAVHTPGRLAIPGNEVFTVSKAVLCAGGFAESANMNSVTVTRSSEPGGTTEHFIVDVEQILEKGRLDKDLALKPGDMIFVPERFKLF
jgi:protein involved in polysaccharide export with SLBB domain